MGSTNKQHKNMMDVYYGSGNSWTKDTFNSDTGKKIASKKYSLSSLLNEEQNYWMDLNNDGITGNGIVRIYDSNPSGGKVFIKQHLMNLFLIKVEWVGDLTLKILLLPQMLEEKYNFKYEPTGSSSIQVMDENGVYTNEVNIYSGLVKLG